MKTYPECLSCFIRQAKDASCRSGVNHQLQEMILEKVKSKISNLSTDLTPPELAKHIYSIVADVSGTMDSYKDVKKKSNDMALEMYDAMKERVSSSPDPLLSAIRLAVAGNVIDYGVPHVFDIEREIEECLSKEFHYFDIDEFRRALVSSSKILYLLDNAGEIVFDRILIETIGKDIVCAVREKPVINDVTIEDAQYVGLDKVAKVISSGSILPGTVLPECTSEFSEYFHEADLIISKGQGNFETLSDSKRPIFFIFKAKCPVVARFLACREGDIILKST